MPNRLIGREAEQAVLRRALDSSEAELVAVYGRRRVGKTFLVREFFGERICFELTGAHDAPLKDQLDNFAIALGRAMKSPIRPAAPATWREAFEQLIPLLEGLKRRRERVVFIDELPWLASRRSRFLSALEHFWNAWASRQSRLVVVVCGSAASWMLEKVIHQRGGLFGRVTRRLHLEPFTLAETDRYLQSREVRLGHSQVLELYMAMGGIPHYLKEVERGQSAAQSIDSICFSRAGLLADEFDQLCASLFAKHERHVAVIRALARKRAGMTRTEVLQAAGLASGGGATVLLDELLLSGFVARWIPFGKTAKDALYRLSDEYSLFYLNWIERHRSGDQDVWLKKSSSPAWRAWAGYAFESVCLKHVPQLKRALGIAAVETEAAGWWHRPEDRSEKGAQIDLLIDRRDDCINVCEMKFCAGEFVIDKRYAADLRNKLEVFRRVTGTRKTLLLTMVTSHGVRENSYRRELVANTIELGSLFV